MLLVSSYPGTTRSVEADDGFIPRAFLRPSAMRFFEQKLPVMSFIHGVQPGLPRLVT